MKFASICFALALVSAIAASAQGPVYISQETQMAIPGITSLIYFGGAPPSGGGVYGTYLVGNQVEFGVYTVGMNRFGYVQTDPTAQTTPGGIGPSISISPLYSSTHSQELLWVGAIGFQTADAYGPSGSTTITQSKQPVTDARTRSYPAIACAQITNGICAVAWTGVNPPLGGDFNNFLEGNVNVATNANATVYAKPGPLSGGIPNAYADGAPVIVFRGSTLYIGYVGTDSSRAFNIIWSNDYQTFSPAITGIQGTIGSLAVQGSKLVVAWPAGGVLHIGYWTGDPTGPMTWQGTITRKTGAGDQAVQGGVPTISPYLSGLILCWKDASNGLTTALVTVP